MMPKKFGTHTQAVAGVIEALLMVALVTIVISVVQLYYIPQVMEQKEAEHMDQVFNQFSSLKSMVDMQTITRSSSPISSMITLGSRELPYFITAKATGDLSTNENPAFKIEFNPPLIGMANSVSLTSIVYRADNSYFVDQSYILEGGGIIVTQPDGISVMRSDPSISAVNNSGTIVISMDYPHVMALPGKNNTGGDGKCYIRTNYSSNRTYNGPIDSPFGYIKIYTQYLNAWNTSLFGILGIYDANGYLHITVHGTQPSGYIEITPGSKNIQFKLNIIDILVQIGPGWVE